jgi:hypothetical protein
MVFQKLLCGECYEDVNTANYPLFKVLNDGQSIRL